MRQRGVEMGRGGGGGGCCGESEKDDGKWQGWGSAVEC